MASDRIIINGFIGESFAINYINGVNFYVYGQNISNSKTFNYMINKFYLYYDYSDKTIKLGCENCNGQDYIINSHFYDLYKHDFDLKYIKGGQMNYNSDEHEFLKRLCNSIIKIQRNWRIALYNKRYRSFMAQVLTVPENHDSDIGKLFPNGGYDYQKFKQFVYYF